ncbi:hypothetical protein LCGC14_1544540 [marine sediment metagenome]|uniref:Uncharacterized protein n=1 Tax=marine sediment metagenome TaxID=412755 RepID=A0A0F9JD06_9ZZZZ
MDYIYVDNKDLLTKENVREIIEQGLGITSKPNKIKEVIKRFKEIEKQIKE